MNTNERTNDGDSFVCHVQEHNVRHHDMSHRSNALIRVQRKNGNDGYAETRHGTITNRESEECLSMVFESNVSTCLSTRTNKRERTSSHWNDTGSFVVVAQRVEANSSTTTTTIVFSLLVEYVHGTLELQQ
jgi:hypothetical protein